MVSPQFPIPDEFQSQLTYVEPQDHRSHEEIIGSLQHFRPVVGERNIWCYWHSGLSSMPAWCQRNVADWVRINGLSWTVRVLDTVPHSPNHILNYISEDLLPETLIKGTMDGPYVGPHSSDFLRGACLYEHGGVYLDVGCILIRQFERIGWDQLEDPQNPRQILVPWMYGTMMANHFIAARKQNPFIKRWHDLFLHVWKDRTNYQGLGAHPLLTFAQSLDFSESQQRGFKWEFIVGPEHVFQYITQCVAWLRICMLEDPNDGFNGREYQRDHILWYDVFPEGWRAEMVVGFTGEALFNAFATKTNADPESEEYKKAYELVWTMLSQASMQKVTHGKNLTKTPALGLLWDEKENEGKDIEPGTFAQLFRYGCTHFGQSRGDIQFVQTELPKEVLKKGLLEP